MTDLDAIEKRAREAKAGTLTVRGAFEMADDVLALVEWRRRSEALLSEAALDKMVTMRWVDKARALLAESREGK